jgi:DNA-binding transcriptional MerR regulator
MSLWSMHNPAVPPEPTLADLAAASGLQPRTIRSWVAQGLLPAPLSRGPTARYPADTLERLLAIRAMREVLHRSLAEIRQDLLVATPEALRALADKARGLLPEPDTMARAAPSSALEYIHGLRESAPPVMAAMEMASLPLALPSQAPSGTGFAALEQTLGRLRPHPSRKARGEEWLRLAITPDVELAVRGPLDAEARARLERCADLIRDILLGRDR